MTDEERRKMEELWAARDAEDEREAAADRAVNDIITARREFRDLARAAEKAEAKERAEMRAQAAADAALDGGK